MADTTTTLNVGSGGDKMDESSVLQSDNVTSVKRPRVVIGGDAGYNGTVNDLVQPVTTDPGVSAPMLPVVAGALVDDTGKNYVPGELRPLSTNAEGRLRVTTIPAETYLDHFGDENRPADTDPNGLVFCMDNNPWGF